jgi:hypothetical protein
VSETSAQPIALIVAWDFPERIWMTSELISLPFTGIHPY